MAAGIGIDVGRRVSVGIQFRRWPATWAYLQWRLDGLKGDAGSFIKRPATY